MVGLVVGLVASGIAVVLGKLMEVKHWVRVGSGCSLRAFIVSFKCFPYADISLYFCIVEYCASQGSM